MKKRIAIILFAAIAAAMLLVGCATANETYYKVNLAYNSEEGTITLSEPRAGLGYTYGEAVTATIQPNEGYYVAGAQIGGQIVKISALGGSYSFTLTGDTEVAVAFTDVKPIVFTVEALFDETLGTAVFSAPRDPIGYFGGEKVQLTVTPNDGYAVQSVKIGGTLLEAADGVYTFTVGGDTVVEIEFTESASAVGRLTEDALQALKGNVTFSGYIYYDYEGEAPEHTSSETIISYADGFIYVYEKFDNGMVYHNYVQTDHNGELAAVYHNNYNEVVYMDLGEVFDEVYNPFRSLQPSDFEPVEDNVYRLRDGLVQHTAYVFTKYIENYTDLLLYLENGEISRVVVISARNTDTTVGDNDEHITSVYGTRYEFDVTDVGVGCVPESSAAPYEKTAEHEALETALSAAASAESYTVNYSIETNFGVSAEYTVYVTPTAIYSAVEGFEDGYMLIDGKIRKFIYDAEKGETTVGAQQDATTIKQLTASFSGFLPELFGYKDGVYKPRGGVTIIGMSLGIEMFAARAFEVTPDDSFADTTDMSIILNNGSLYQVELISAIGGANSSYTLTFYNYNKTQIPVNLGNIVNR